MGFSFCNIFVLFIMDVAPLLDLTIALQLNELLPKFMVWLDQLKDTAKRARELKKKKRKLRKAQGLPTDSEEESDEEEDEKTEEEKEKEKEEKKKEEEEASFYPSLWSG